MQKRFGEQLGRYSELAKKDFLERGGEGAVEVEQALAEVAAENETSIDIQRDVYGLQKKKQEILDRLRQELRALDHPNGEDRSKEKEVQWDEQEGRLRVYLGRDNPRFVTLGALITDAVEWGGSYRMASAVPRAHRKKFLVERAKAEIRGLFHRQVAMTWASSRATEGRGNDGAYAAILERETHPESLPAGVVAEKMVRSLLGKISIDGQDSFSVEEADPYEDVEHKIDLIIRVKVRRRGVNVDTEERHDIGIQLTTSGNAQTLAKKEEQVRRAQAEMMWSKEKPVDDLVLVRLPLGRTEEVYRTWRKDRKRLPPGGPDALLGGEEKAVIVRGVLQHLIPGDQLDAIAASLRREERI